MSDISESFLNQKRVNLISKICGEESAHKLKESFKDALGKSVLNLDDKTLKLLDFITRLDNISSLSETNKELYNVGNRKVYVVKTQKDLNHAVQNLLKSKILGFDTEQKPVFKKGVPPTKISIVQLSDANYSYIFQIQQIANITPLLDLLASSKILKVGIGLRGDSSSLLNEFNITLKACIDFGSIFKTKLYYENELGAKKSVLFFLNKKLQKSGRSSRSNWEIANLSDSQIKYASEDASCVYDVFCTMLVQYPFVAEVLPPWFKDKYNRGDYTDLLEVFNK